MKISCDSISHKGIPAGNHNAIPLHTQQDGYNQTDSSKCWQERGGTGFLLCCGGSENWCGGCESRLAPSSKGLRESARDPAVPLQVPTPRTAELNGCNKACPQMFTAA